MNAGGRCKKCGRLVALTRRGRLWAHVDADDGHGLALRYHNTLRDDLAELRCDGGGARPRPDKGDTVNCEKRGRGTVIEGWAMGDGRWVVRVRWDQPVLGGGIRRPTSVRSASDIDIIAAR